MRIRRSLHVVNQDDGEDRRKTEHSIVSRIKVSVLFKDQRKKKKQGNPQRIFGVAAVFSCGYLITLIHGHEKPRLRTDKVDYYLSVAD